MSVCQVEYVVVSAAVQWQTFSRVIADASYYVVKLLAIEKQCDPW